MPLPLPLPFLSFPWGICFFPCLCRCLSGCHSEAQQRNLLPARSAPVLPDEQGVFSPLKPPPTKSGFSPCPCPASHPYKMNSSKTAQNPLVTPPRHPSEPTKPAPPLPISLQPTWHTYPQPTTTIEIDPPTTTAPTPQSSTSSTEGGGPPAHAPTASGPKHTAPTPGQESSQHRPQVQRMQYLGCKRLSGREGRYFDT